MFRSRDQGHQRRFRRLLLGSVADKVVRGAGKPVSVYRPAVAAG
ncbi:MAG: universal stress protein [Gemmatimonadetes bacterium]|nr:universal stress protein [Gemmatimonadota bacterium]